MTPVYKPLVSMQGLRQLAILLGAACLFWLLLIEDRSPAGALAFSALFCALVSAFFWTRQALLARRLPLPALGLAAGLAISPLALLLMALKTGVHAHPVPDYSGSQVAAVFLLLPVLAFGGLLVGLGARLWVKARQQRGQREG